MECCAGVGGGEVGGGGCSAYLSPHNPLPHIYFAMARHRIADDVCFLVGPEDGGSLVFEVPEGIKTLSTAWIAHLAVSEGAAPPSRVVEEMARDVPLLAGPVLFPAVPGWVAFPADAGDSVVASLFPLVQLPHTSSTYREHPADVPIHAVMTLRPGCTHYVRVICQSPAAVHALTDAFEGAGVALADIDEHPIIYGVHGHVAGVSEDQSVCVNALMSRPALAACARGKVGLSMSGCVIAKLRLIDSHRLSAHGGGAGAVTVEGILNALMVGIYSQASSVLVEAMHKSGALRRAVDDGLLRSDPLVVTLLRSIGWTMPEWLAFARTAEHFDVFRCASDLLSCVVSSHALACAPIEIVVRCSTQIGGVFVSLLSHITRRRFATRRISVYLKTLGRFLSEMSVLLPGEEARAAMTRLTSPFSFAAGFPKTQLPFELVVDACKYPGMDRGAALHLLTCLLIPECADWTNNIAMLMLKCKAGRWAEGLVGFSEALRVAVRDRKSNRLPERFEILGIFCKSICNSLATSPSDLSAVLNGCFVIISSLAKRMVLTNGAHAWHAKDEDAVVDILSQLHAFPKCDTHVVQRLRGLRCADDVRHAALLLEPFDGPEDEWRTASKIFANVVLEVFVATAPNDANTRRLRKACLPSPPPPAPPSAKNPKRRKRRAKVPPPPPPPPAVEPKMREEQEQEFDLLRVPLYAIEKVGNGFRIKRP